MTIDEARLMANVQERAERLFRDGYWTKQLDEHTVEVNSPECERYEVDTVFETCSCPFFRLRQLPCKHLLGYAKLLADQEEARQRHALHAQCGEAEALP